MSISKNRVVVGYDASPESREAVRWAAMVAERRSAPILVVTATPADDLGPGDLYSELGNEGENTNQETADEGAELARQTANVEVTAFGVPQDPATALTGFSEDAQLVVVGHRGSDQLRAGFLGSVAFAVTSHATCPVVVVRESLSGLPSAERPSIVGFDGSEHSIKALHQAAQWTVEMDSTLRIVVAWDGKSAAAPSWNIRDYGQSAEQDSAASTTIRDYGQSDRKRPKSRPQLRAEQVAQSAVEDLQERHPGLKVEPVVTPGRPSEAIVDAAGADKLIFVGARGRGNFASLLLGSVSREVIERAESAVYVIR